MNKVLFISPSCKLGGAEQVLKMIANNLNEEIHVFFLESDYLGTWDDIQGINIHYTRKKNKVGAILEFFNFIRKNRNWDSIYTSHVYITGLTGMLIKIGLLKKKYFIARESTSIFKRFQGYKLYTYKAMYRLGYSSVDLLICQTDYMKSQLINALPWLEKKIKIRTINNPINLNGIDNENLNEVQALPKLPYLVSAGRLIYEKGFDILIKAFLKLNHNYPHLNLLILGEGNEREYLSKLVQDLGLNDKVHLIGFQSNVYPFFKNAELCIVSSRIEGFPNVLLQMMSQNTKVVSTKCAGGIEDIDGVFTCEIDNVEDLYNTMIRCLNTDTKSYRNLFDIELKKRDITEFVKSVEKYLNE